MKKGGRERKYRGEGCREGSRKETMDRRMDGYGDTDREMDG